MIAALPYVCAAATVLACVLFVFALKGIQEMSQRVMFEVYCKTEKVAIGELVLPKGRRINVADIKTGYVPSRRIYAFLDATGDIVKGPDKRAILRDGTQMLCPKCAAPLLLREPDGDKGVYLVPGAFNTAA